MHQLSTHFPKEVYVLLKIKENSYKLMNIPFHFQVNKLFWAQSHSGEQVTGETLNGQLIIRDSLSNFLNIHWNSNVPGWELAIYRTLSQVRLGSNTDLNFH